MSKFFLIVLLFIFSCADKEKKGSNNLSETSSENDLDLTESPTKRYQSGLEALKGNNMNLYDDIIESYTFSEFYPIYSWGIVLAEQMTLKGNYYKSYYDKALLSWIHTICSNDTTLYIEEDIIYNLKKAKQGGYKWEQEFTLSGKEVTYDDIVVN